MLLGKLFAAAKALAPAAKAIAPTGGMARLFQLLSVAFDALVTGSRTIPMGDNGTLLRELGERSARTR